MVNLYSYVKFARGYIILNLQETSIRFLWNLHFSHDNTLTSPLNIIKSTFFLANSHEIPYKIPHEIVFGGPRQGQQGTVDAVAVPAGVPVGLGSSYDQPMSRAAVENLERCVSQIGYGSIVVVNSG